MLIEVVSASDVQIPLWAMVTITAERLADIATICSDSSMGDGNPDSSRASTS